MIHFKRTDNMSISLSFDKEGLEEMTEELRQAQTDNSESIKVKFDKSVISLNKKSPTKKHGLLFQKGEETELKADNQKIIWELTDEDLDNMLLRFEESLETGFFTPAQLFRVTIERSRRINHVYCELLQ